MKELQLPPAEPQDKGRWCQCCTSLRLYVRINGLMRTQVLPQSTASRRYTSICQDPNAWTATLQKRTWGSWWPPRWTRGSTVPLQQRTVAFPSCIRRNFTRRWKDHFLPLPSALERSRLSVVSVSVPFSTRKTWSCWWESSKVTQKWWRHWSVSHMNKG